MIALRGKLLILLVCCYYFHFLFAMGYGGIVFDLGAPPFRRPTLQGRSPFQLSCGARGGLLSERLNGERKKARQIKARHSQGKNCENGLGRVAEK